MDSFYSLDLAQDKTYTQTLAVIAGLSKLFSDSDVPFLHYRVMENLFCSSFNATNLSRSDTAYDAKIGTLGIGLKTFVCQKDSSIQKIAEFNKKSHFLKSQNTDDLAYILADLRNERMQLANDLYGIEQQIYHIIARRNNKLIFFETDYEKIDTSNIAKIIKTDSSLSFSDGKNEYTFNFSKSVLQRKFYIPQVYNEIDIKILDNPFQILLDLKDKIVSKSSAKNEIAGKDYVVLPLYSLKKGGQKYVPEKSGLNQWNAGGRERKYGEMYIPIPRKIHQLAPNFFPPRDTQFILKTPLNESLNVKLCQDNSKALMSNPNTALSNWLLRKIFRLGKYELATLEKLENLGFDSVIITKKADGFHIDIMPINSYENFIETLQYLQQERSSNE